MLRSTLRGMVRLVPFGISVASLVVVAGVFLWQNHTIVSREGDFELATDRDLVMAHRADSARCEALPDVSSLRSEPRPVAKKFVLRKRAGLGLANRGHSTTYEAAFPEFPTTSPFLRDVNRLVSTSHKDAATEFARADWSLVWDEFRDPSFCNREWQGCVETAVIHVSDRAVCLLEMHSEYTGGAHGNYWHVARCFVEENDQARELTLAELFEPSSDWQQRLITNCNDDLRRQGASSLTPLEADSNDNPTSSKSLDIGDLTTFVLAPSGLWFFFAPYHVGCYAEGAYSLRIPYSELQDCLSPNSPTRLFMIVTNPSP